MTVQDDLRRLSQGDSIYLGSSIISQGTVAFASWFKGRLQQSNDGNWIFRSISADGSIAGFQLGQANDSWSSSETPSTGISISIIIKLAWPGIPALNFGTVTLQQLLPQEITN
jgi:hypothetical protein